MLLKDLKYLFSVYSSYLTASKTVLLDDKTFIGAVIVRFDKKR